MKPPRTATTTLKLVDAMGAAQMGKMFLAILSAAWDPQANGCLGFECFAVAASLWRLVARIGCGVLFGKM